MKLEGDGELLRIFIGEADHVDKKPLYLAIVERARAAGLAGATVIRGVLGYGAASKLHSAKILRLSQDLPLVIEIVDTKEKIDAFIQEVDSLLEHADSGCLVTREKVNVIRYRGMK